jgi:thioredoxin-related protein
MNKVLICLIFLNLTFFKAFGQDTLIKPYNPEADAKLMINKAVEEAKASQKHVLIMVGGNWCKWCIRLTKFMDENAKIDSVLKADFIYIHVNYSKENKNPEVMKQLEYPQRFGFPVLVILDGNGKRLHTQNSLYLEKDESYNDEVIVNFLLDWNYNALHPVEN